ncbi:hypothetical protein B0H16DRAFT_1335416 [Mycena metata]|uniref:Uncharacterized protein n=1 Tax=Mycena metata TaxID=1033252 RepID=A0AAD7HIH3_9AGAR|nr:hypothetical protein B0H16DRAFT_1335416 [Mycena metata]
MADPLSNLRAAYGVLETRVNRALRIQLGDTARLCLQRDEAFRLLESAEPHHNLFSPAEFTTLQESISTMADRLDEACHLSTDPQEGPSITVVADSVTGKRGHPKKNINPAFLEEALTLRGPTGLSDVLRCHPRTIRRRALELGLAAPGVPVYHEEVLPDGGHNRAYTGAPRPAAPSLTDEQLDTAVAEILDVFPA